MSSKLFTLALLQLGLSLFLVSLVAFSTFKIIKRLIMRKHHIELNNENLAFAWLASAIIFAVGYMVSGVIQPLLSVLRVLNARSDDALEVLVGTLKYSLLFIGLGFVIAFIVVLIGLYLFTWLNKKVDELKEIANNNQSVGIITGAIIIVVALLVKDSAVLLLESMVPYPDMPLIR